MNPSNALQKFGLPSSAEHREAILDAIESQLNMVFEGDPDAELGRCLVAQLFSIGAVEDSLVIWRMKSSGFDCACGIDVQFVCGAGVDETIRFLEQSNDPDAAEALDYLRGCIGSGDFDSWTPAIHVGYYRYYYGLDPEPSEQRTR